MVACLARVQFYTTDCIRPILNVKCIDSVELRQSHGGSLVRWYAKAGQYIDLQNGPAKRGVAKTPLLSTLLRREERALRRSQIGPAWLELQSQQM